jgi:acyl-CoA hydrolase
MARSKCPVARTRNTITKMMQPTEANIYGYVHGGEIMKLVDEAAFVSATRLARMNVVTASVDRHTFDYPVKIGNLLILKSQVNCVGKTSMEVGVRIETEDVKAGKTHKVGSAYLTMVALDDLGNPTIIPLLSCESQTDKARQTRAVKRRKERMGQRARRSSVD